MPVLAEVPIAEKEQTKPWLFVEPSGVPTGSGMAPSSSESPSPDGEWWVVVSNQQATPTESLYIWFDSLPTELVFGTPSGPRYRHSFG